jgi:signal transduction histidine kinase
MIRTASESPDARILRPNVQTPTDRTVLQGIAVARWAIFGWLAVTTAVQRDELAHPWAAAVALIVALMWTAGCTVLLRRSPRSLANPLFVTAEVAIAWGLLLVDGWVFTTGHSFGSGQNLAGNWPLVAAIAAATSVGPWWGALIGAVAASGRYFGALLNGVTSFPGERILSLVSSAVFYAVSAVVFGAITRRLRTVENEVALARARDEVARTLHDGVLQTLALVDRRTRVADPELAMVARSTDRELRAWLFHGSRTDDVDASLEERLRRVADKVAHTYDLAVSVSVLDDYDARSKADPILSAIAGAVGEALTNVAKHAGATRAVVFAEVDEQGSMFASVSDDGVGFDTTVPRSGHGIDASIQARLQEVGARAEIISKPGAGTEVQITAQLGR